MLFDYRSRLLENSRSNTVFTKGLWEKGLRGEWFCVLMILNVFFSCAKYGYNDSFYLVIFNSTRLENGGSWDVRP